MYLCFRDSQIKEKYKVSILSVKMGSELSHVSSSGNVSPGYESVRDLFEGGFVAGREQSAQLCVYVGEEMVVNLWHSINNPAYTKDTLTNIFSCSKNLTSIAMAMLHDKGLLRYDARIQEYWPEFSGEGKEEITVADLLRHEAGYANYPLELESMEVLLAENIKKNSIGKLYKDSMPRYPTTGKREYHIVTRGLLANEVFRRIEPSGCTIGEFLRRELSDKFGVRVFIGVTEDEMDDFEPVENAGIVSASHTAISTLPYREWSSFLVEVMWNSVPFKVAGKRVDYLAVNQEQFRRAELPSGCANASAEGLAKVAAFLANKGKLSKERLMTEHTWKMMHAEVTDAGLIGDWCMTHFSQGGVNRYQTDDFFCCGRDGFWGWMGYGGSVFQWHPELRIGFAYVPTRLEWSDLTNSKGGLLQEEVVRCVKRTFSSVVRNE